MAYEKKMVKKFHEKAKKEAQKFNLSISSKIKKSDLESSTIVATAKKEKVDLIVMSKTKLKTHAERVYYNSTVDAVFKKTPCAFLYIP